ncbi:LysE family translocator [Arthrobacter sp. I2-34]|uniref:LysE family translocator n=1 Tax=Arthrobacter hankyongi TaxID=2904801 RepID=A0ABS9L8S4_9MICC|nr:LysE family translocator [Arthrobacter hankyongi]MCG2623081.1 LysE family translocator [Arthrobacter hankyongi]
MSVPQALLSFAVVAGLLTIIPGLDTALVLRSAISRHRGYAFATALGIITGALVWGVAAAVGVSALLAASELAYRVLVYAGAAYMMWLGGSMLWRSFARRPVAEESSGLPAAAPRTTPRDLAKGWLVGAGTNLLNPKVGVFYVATIPQFIPLGASPLAMGILLAGVHGLLSLAWFALIIFGTGLAGKWLGSLKTIRIVDRITGTVLVGFGLKLALHPR